MAEVKWSYLCYFCTLLSISLNGCVPTKTNVNDDDDWKQMCWWGWHVVCGEWRGTLTWDVRHVTRVVRKATSDVWRANGVVRGKLHVERATCDVWGVEIDKRCV